MTVLSLQKVKWIDEMGGLYARMELLPFFFIFICENRCSDTSAYSFPYSPNLHPQSGTLDLNTVDVRAGESLTRLPVEIFRARVRGNETRVGVWPSSFRKSRFSWSSSNGIYSDWTSARRPSLTEVTRNPSRIRDLTAPIGGTRNHWAFPTFRNWGCVQRERRKESKFAEGKE